MTRLGLWLLALALAGALVAASASAAGADRIVERAFLRGEVAAQQYGYRSRCWPITWRWVDTPQPDYNWYAGVRPGASCVIDFNATFREFWEEPSNRSVICSMVLHEIGHLSGLGHSDDLYSPMHSSSFRTPKGCWRQGDVWWGTR